jgi:uncharacterized protein HemY
MAQFGMHPLRCENCDKTLCQIHPEYPGINMRYRYTELTNIREAVSYIGCASHPANKKQKEKELQKYCQTFPHAERNRTLLDYIDLKISSLKRAKNPEYLSKIKPAQREMVNRQIRGRILELTALKSAINRGDYEKESILKPLRNQDINHEEKLK